jgi:hypothetical protein
MIREMFVSVSNNILQQKFRKSIGFADSPQDLHKKKMGISGPQAFW